MKIYGTRWENLDARLAEIEGGIDLDTYLSPSNRKAEFNTWLTAYNNGESYNPVFEFDPLPDVREDDLWTFLKSLEKSDPLESVYSDAARLRLGEIEMCKIRRGDIISHRSTAIYGKPGETLLKQARQNLAELPENDPILDGETINAEEAAEICRKAMTDYGFSWKVVVKKEMGAKALVDNLIKEFWIRDDVVWSMGVMKMIVVHEIGTHIFRTENGYAQPLGIFGRGLPAYQLTEEGLAEYTELETGCLHNDTIRRISARVIGVDVALRGSFSDVVEAVKGYQEPDMLFDIAQRAKLGQADTSQPGSYTKDYCYLEGFYRMKEWFEASPSQEDLDSLFAGKVGFQHLNLVKELQKDGYLHKPKQLPDWLGETSAE